VWLGAWTPTEYEVGDIVYFHPPDDEKIYVKRVVAVAGTTLSLDEDGNIILEKPDGSVTATDWKVPALSRDSYPMTVPTGSVYVVGDNTTNSRDSRCFGCVPVQSILGHVTAIKISD
jgi:signal peptidase I